MKGNSLQAVARYIYSSPGHAPPCKPVPNGSERHDRVIASTSPSVVPTSESPAYEEEGFGYRPSYLILPKDCGDQRNVALSYKTWARLSRSQVVHRGGRDYGRYRHLLLDRAETLDLAQ